MRPGKIAYQYDGKVERLAIKKISGGGTLPGPFQLGGVSDQYFAAVFLPQDPQERGDGDAAQRIEIRHKPSDPNDKQMDKVDVLGAAVGSLKGATECPAVRGAEGAGGSGIGGGAGNYRRGAGPARDH